MKKTLFFIAITTLLCGCNAQPTITVTLEDAANDTVRVQMLKADLSDAESRTPEIIIAKDGKFSYSLPEKSDVARVAYFSYATKTGEGQNNGILYLVPGENGTYSANITLGKYDGSTFYKDLMQMIADDPSKCVVQNRLASFNSPVSFETLNQIGRAHV